MLEYSMWCDVKHIKGKVDSYNVQTSNFGIEYQFDSEYVLLHYKNGINE